MNDPYQVTLDPWTYLTYKKSAFGDHAGPWKNAPWLSEQDRRRLSAYLVLAAYARNTARTFQRDNARQDEIREYGDPALILDQALSALLGETQEIVVDEAADESLLDRDADQAPTDDESEAVENEQEIRDAVAWQEALREWADDEHLDLTILDGERKAIGLGDAVYVLYWDTSKDRVRVVTYDPGFYFPVLPTDDKTGDYPERVHFVWETAPADNPDGVGRLVRLTYEMGLIQPTYDDGTGEFSAPEGTRFDAEGYLVRDYPWSDEPSRYTCYMTQREWKTGDVAVDRPEAGPDGLSIAKSTVVTRDDGVPLDHLDLGIDFMPIVHVPNTWPGEEHFGTAILSSVAQGLDDLQEADTDAQRASATTGAPIIAASGVNLPSTNSHKRLGPAWAEKGRPVANDTYLQIRPGTVLSLGENGRLTTVDTSSNLGAMADRVDHLRARITQNVRIPDVALGIVGEAANQMSGVAIELRYGPMQNMIRQMRRVRAEKYALLLKITQRFMMLGDEAGDLPGRTVRAEIRFGAYMPRDLETAIKQVTEARNAKVISTETAVKVLQTAGLPIEDAVAEVKRINSENYEAAVRLLDATNDPAAVRNLLGLEAQQIRLGAPVVATGLPATGGAPVDGSTGDEDEPTA